MRGTRFAAALAVVVFGAGLMASPAAAKCSPECKTLIRDTGMSQFLACKDACTNNPSITKKKDRNICIKKLCKRLKARKSWKHLCKTNSGTPPSCGSPSGAFVDASNS